MAHAHKVAKPGQRVLLLPGDYGPQDLGETGPGGRQVVFAPAAAPPSLQSLTIENASNLSLRRLAVAGQIAIENEHPERPGPSNISLLGVKAKTLRLTGRIAKITVRGGSYGNAVNAQPQIKKYNPEDPDIAQPTDILIDGVAFHDFRRTDDTIHTECLQILNGMNVTVRNSRFWNCDGTGDIGITPTGLITNLTLENNFIGGGGDTGYGVQIGMKLRNFVFRYNSSSQSVFFSDTLVTGPYTFVGNYMPWDYSLCHRAATYESNVLDGGKCGPTDFSVSALQFVDAKDHDLHLAPRSAAIGRGSAATRPAGDIDGDTRPSGFRPDAGADQRETALLAPGRSIGRVILGASEASVRSFYGGGRSSKVRVGGKIVKRLSYRLHRGTLWAYLDGGKVVGAGTTSGYYSGPAGLSAGESSARMGRGFTWVPCANAYVRPTRGTALVVATSAGRRGGTIRAIGIVRAAYAACSRR